MAIYHLSMKIIGRGSGCEIATAVAYRAGEKVPADIFAPIAYRTGGEMQNEHKEKTYDYTNKKGIVHSEIMLPESAPDEFKMRYVLCNAIEKSEKRKNAQLAREIVIALPNELTTERQIECIRKYIKENFVDEGMCADFSIHAGHIHSRKGEIYPFEDLAIRKENPHVHIVLTTRHVTKNGFGNKNRDWNKRENLLKWRKNWALTVNEEFERLGIDERISHLSLKAQGIDREPTKHMGHKAWALECKGKKTEIGDKNREIMQRNIAKFVDKTAEHIHELKQEYVSLDKKISILQQENDNDERGQLRADRISLVDENAGISERVFSMKTENKACLQQMKEDGRNIRGITHYRIDIQKIEREMNTLILEEMNTSFFKINQRRNLKEQISALDEKKKKIENSFEKRYDRSFENAVVLQDYLRANLLHMRTLIHENNKQSTELEKQQSDNAEKIQQLRKKEIEVYQNLTKHIQKLYEEKEEFKLEYQIQKKLVEISPHRNKILEKLAQLDKETHANETPKERILRIQRERILGTVTDRKPPEQTRTIERYR